VAEFLKPTEAVGFGPEFYIRLAIMYSNVWRARRDSNPQPSDP